MERTTFALIGDPQYADREPWNGRNYADGLALHKSLISALNQRDLDFLVNLGDLGDGIAKEEVPVMLESCAASVHPFRHVVGNHDFVQNSESELKRLLNLDSFFYDFARNGVRFLVLNGLDESRFAPRGSERYANYERYKREHPYRELREWDGMLSAASKQWLREKLDQARDRGEDVIVFSHVPVCREASGGNAVMWDHAELLTLLDSYSNIRAFFAGHYHPGGLACRNGVLHKTVKALCNVSVPTACVCHVYEDRIVLEGIGEEGSFVHFFDPKPVRLSGFAVPGACVMANTGEMVRADGEGRFSLEVCCPGVYALKSVADGYADSVLPLVQAPAADLRLQGIPDPGRYVVHGRTEGFSTLKIMENHTDPIRWFDLNGTAFGSLEKPGSWHEHSRNFWTRGEYAFSAKGVVEIEEEPFHRTLREQGWFKGDFHAHIIHGENFYCGNLPMIAFAARAEHYDWLYCAERHGNSPYPDDAMRLAKHFSGDHFLLKLNSEFPKNLNGHIGNLGIPPVLFPIDFHKISNFELAERYIYKHGGVAVPVHPLYDDGAKTDGIARMTGKEVILWLLLNPEMCPCLDLFYHDNTPGAAEFWYMLLNRGYRIGVTATSDAAFDVGRTPGSDRGSTFVQMDSLSEANLLRGIRERRTMVSWNGGALTLAIDGKRSGSVLAPSGRHRLTAELFYRPGRRVVLKIIRNGLIFAEKELTVPKSGSFRMEIPIHETESCWYLGILSEAEHMDRILSAVSPVYFRTESFQEPRGRDYPREKLPDLCEKLRRMSLAELTDPGIFTRILLFMEKR